MADKAKEKSPLALRAAERLDELYTRNSGDPRYLRNLTGQGGTKITKETHIEPQRKIAAAMSLSFQQKRKRHLAQLAELLVVKGKK